MRLCTLIYEFEIDSADGHKHIKPSIKLANALDDDKLKFFIESLKEGIYFTNIDIVPETMGFIPKVAKE